MRLLQALPQSTKLLLAGLLFVLAVALWYALFFRPPQSRSAPAPGAPQALPTRPGAPQGGTPKTIEALPVPFVAEPGPKTSKGGQKAQTAPQTSKPPPAPLPAQRAAEPLPNPFAPLRVAVPKAPPSVPAPPSPLPRGAPVRVSPGSPLPTPTPVPVSRERATSRRLGTPLPLPRVVEAPASLPPLPEAPLPSDVLLGERGASEASFPLQETLATPQAGSPPKGEPGGESPSLTPLQAFVAEKGLRLSGVILGPVSVVILGSKEGYQVLPVGSSLPGSEVVIRSATAESVVLALGDETLTLNLDGSHGGER